MESKVVGRENSFSPRRDNRRTIMVKPPPQEAKTNKAVYGLKDAARVWYETVVKVISERGGQRSRLDHTLFVWKKKKRIIGIMVIHVDDFCYGGERESFIKAQSGR